MNLISTLLFNYVGRRKRLALIAMLLFLLLGNVAESRAQNDFISGSTGADGAFSPSANQTIQVPESGVFNFTTINIPTGVTITFTPNSQNTPVTFLATGNVTIAGTLAVNGGGAYSSGMGGTGGPGGARGGAGGFTSNPFSGTAGDGRGGGGPGNSNNGSNQGGGGGGGYAIAGPNGNANGNGNAMVGQGGLAYGSSSLLPLMGGSGGGGGGGGPVNGGNRGGAGGGGGGALLIASSGTITVSGSIQARGGDGGFVYAGGGGGAGSGGAVRLIANTVTGSGAIDVRGGTGGSIYYSGSPGADGARGFLRVETYDYSSFSPNVFSVPMNISLPNPVFAPNNPQLRISSIAGVTVPVVTKGSMQSAPDVVLPGSLPNPVELQIQATNVPLDSVAEVVVTTPSGTRSTYQSTALSGTVSTSTATASVTLPSGISVVTINLTINLQTAGMRPLFIDGERINRIEVAAVLGGEPQTLYITKSGKRLKFPETSR